MSQYNIADEGAVTAAWSSAQRDTRRRGTYAILHGRAYPRVHKGANVSNVVRASAHDREQLWRDPAIVLSDRDLDECGGAHGLPLKYEHGRDPEVRDETVGSVQYTSLADDDGLDIVARVPIRTPDGRDIERGLQIVEQVRAGRIKGFSVGYRADVRGGGRVVGKQFDEISLVEEPFFEGCNLTVGVVASAAAANDSGE